MTNLLTLLAECECWLGVEPTDEAQVAEVAELRERVRKTLAGASSRIECNLCDGDPDARVWLTRPDGTCEFVRCPHPVASKERAASEKEPLPKAAASFLSDVAAKRGLDGLE